MAVSLGDLILTLSLDDKLSKKLGETSSKLKDFGKGLLPLSAAIGGVGVAGFKMANDLNRAMANVATLMPNSTARIYELKDAVTETAHATGKGSVDIAEGLYQVVSAGVAASDQIKFLEVAAKAGAAGLSTTRDAVDLLALVTKGYGDITSEAAEKTADLAFMTVKLGLTTFPELAASMGAVVPIAKSLNVSQEELFAGFATLTGVTGDAAEVSTQLKSVMSDMMKPSDDMAAAIARLEFSGVEAMISQLGLVGAMQKLIGTTDGSVEAVGKLFNNVRALPAVFALSGAQAKSFEEKLIAMGGAAGSSKEAFGEQTTGIGEAAFEWDRLKHEAAGLARAIGDELSKAFVDLKPQLTGVIDGIRDLIKGFSELPQPVKDVTIGLGAFVAVLGPAIYAVGTLVGVAGTLVKGFVAVQAATFALGNSVPVLTARIWLMGGGFNALMISAGGALMVLTKIAAAFAVGFAVGSIIRMGLEWAGLAKYIDQAFSAVRQFFMGSNAQLEKGTRATSNMTAEQRKVYDEFVATQKKLKGALEGSTGAVVAVTGAQAKLGDATKTVTAATDADIAAKLKTTQATDLLQKATELYGEQVADPQFAARIVALYEAQEKGSQAATKETERHVEAVKSLTKALTDAGQVKVQQEGVGDLQGAITAVGGATKLSLDELKRFTEEFAKLGPVGRAAADSLKEAWTKGNEGVQVLSTSTRQFNEYVDGSSTSYKTFEQQVGEAAENIKKDLDEQTKATDVQKAAIDQLYARGLISGAQYDELLKKVGIDTGKVVQETESWAEKFARVAEGLTLLASIGGTLGEIADVLAAGAQAASNYDTRLKDLGTALAAGKISQEEFSDEKFVAQIGLAAAAATMLGSALAKSTNATIAQAGAALQGAAAGMKMGATFGPIGAGIGAAVGGIMGFISAGKKMKAEVTKLYDEFVKSAGGMEKLKDKAEQAGVSLEAVFKNKGTKNVNAMKKAVEEANAKMDAFDDLLQEVSAKDLTELTIRAAEAGVSLQAIWDAKTVEEYQAAVDEVKGKMDLWQQASDALNEAMDRYGISIEELGPKFAQQKLNEQAATLIQDWQLLAGVGVDINTLIDKMGPSMNDFVNTAIAAGATIPEALRPSLDAMFKAGKLLHEDGRAFTEAEYQALSFGKTQEEMFDSLIEKITSLVNALLGIPDVDYDVTQHNRTEGQQDEHPPHPGGPPEEMAVGDVVTSPTLAVVGEAGPEVVMPLDQLAAIRAGAGGSDSAAIVAAIESLKLFLPNEMMRAMRAASALRPN
jgi:TP901 family phage tail tape measure protein